MKSSLVVVVASFAGLFVACGGSSPDALPDGGDTDTTQGTDTNDPGDTEDPGTDTNDPGTDTGNDSDTEDTSTYENPCPAGQHAGCYGNEVWCLDGDDTPVSLIESCSGGEQCVVKNDNAAVCECTTQFSQVCHNGDAWWVDSCGEFESLIETCSTEEPCVETGEGTVGCCGPEAEQICDTEGNVRWADSCGVERELIETCTANRECEIVAGVGSCACANHWEGENCDVCPEHWDAAQDCNACAGYWSGADCATCGGFGDLCQCPDDQHVPQPGVMRCWTCPSGVITDGVCYYSTEGASDVDTYANVEAAAPAGFRLPTLDEFYSLFADACISDGGGNKNCSPCANDSGCSIMFKQTFSNRPYFWTKDDCGGDISRKLIFFLGVNNMLYFPDVSCSSSDDSNNSHAAIYIR